jgi:multidrug efflux pump subunit AcrB
VVTTSYPGASAQVVADTVAAPIEQEVNGVEGMMSMVSQSTRDGSYTLTVTFKPGTDLKIAQVLVQNRVALALRVLPDVVKRAGVAVKFGPARRSSKQVVIALQDRADHGHTALRRWSAAVVKRLVRAGAAVKPEVFPGPDEERVDVRLDRAKCAKMGVAVADAQRAAQAAVKAAGPPPLSAAKIAALKKVKVTSAMGDKVPLAAVASFAAVTGPAVVYRVNQYPSVRISGLPPKGKMAAEAAARWVELARAGRMKGFEVENLTGK